MKYKKRIVMSMVWLMLGAVLIALSFAGKLDDFWNGMGFGLVAIGALQLLRQYRLSRNEDYRERMEIEAGDERNRFLSCKAWAWAGYWFILAAAVSSLVLHVLGQELLSAAATGALCLMLVLYCGSYAVLRRKY